MDLKLICATLFGIYCSSQFACADPDCANLRDRADEIAQCCQVTPIIQMKDADDCSSAADGVDEPHEKRRCHLQCQLQSLGVMNGKDVVPEAVLEHASRLEGDWKDTAVEVANRCNRGLSKVKEEIAAKSEDMECSPVSGLLMMCLTAQTMELCPADKWQDTDFCNKIKSGECFKQRKHQ